MGDSEETAANLAGLNPRERDTRKKDSGSARKEKQQIRKTCNYPNRLNL